jgi:hypothetical protein
MRRMESMPVASRGGGASMGLWAKEPKAAGATKRTECGVRKIFCGCSGEYEVSWVTAVFWGCVLQQLEFIPASGMGQFAAIAWQQSECIIC